MDDWKPIETAPTDETEVLTYRRGGMMAVAASYDQGWCVSDGARLVNVTHWTPLPQPPQIEPPNRQGI